MKNIYSILCFFIIGTSLFSCYKEKDTTATVIVLKASDSTAVKNTRVRMYADGSTRLDTTLKTTNSGRIYVDYTEEFKAGQGGFAVLDIDVEFTDTTGEYKVGVIKIEAEKENEQTVYCISCP